MVTKQDLINLLKEKEKERKELKKEERLFNREEIIKSIDEIRENNILWNFKSIINNSEIEILKQALEVIEKQRKEILEKLCKKDFIMSILYDCVSVDEEERMKFICVDDVREKFKQILLNTEYCEIANKRLTEQISKERSVIE